LGGGRRTWDFEPIAYSFNGLLIDTSKKLTGQSLPYTGRVCPNIDWKTKAGDASHCLQKIMENDYEDCGRKFITFNANGGGCACYPPEQESCTKSETTGQSGRQTFELEVDPAYVPPSAPKSASPSKSPSKQPSANPTLSELPTSSPSKSPSKQPSNSPTSMQPSNSPSKSPSVEPSTSPTGNQPSTSPTPAQAIACFEDGRDEYFSHSKAGVEKIFKCSNLSKRNDKNKDKICARTESSASGTKPAKDVCPVTCGTCPSGSCEEIVSDKFFHYAKKKNGKFKYSNCRRLQVIRKADSTKADKICNRVAPSNSKHPSADVRCPVTCGTCSTSSSTTSTIMTTPSPP